MNPHTEMNANPVDKSLLNSTTHYERDLLSTSIVLLSTFIVFLGTQSGAAEEDPKQAEQKQTAEELTLKDAEYDKIHYLQYIPTGKPKDSTAWPLVLFLHGAGERGEDLNLVKKHGPPKLIEQGKEYPFIVISPQCPKGKRWSSNALNQLLDEVESKHKVNKQRIYVTGLSMGGYGTWTLISSSADRFAAAIPICGGGNPEHAEKFKDLPIWVFHGGKDNVVPLKSSEKMVDALKEINGNVKFTIYPDAGHDSWTETYNNEEVFKWMLEQKNTSK